MLKAGLKYRCPIGYRYRCIIQFGPLVFVPAAMRMQRLQEQVYGLLKLLSAAIFFCANAYVPSVCNFHLDSARGGAETAGSGGSMNRDPRAPGAT